MTSQADFWKPKPYDFEGIVAGVDLNKLSTAYVNRAKAHAKTDIRWLTTWATLERFYDGYDRAHFERTDIAPKNDVWDNRKKRASA